MLNVSIIPEAVFINPGITLDSLVAFKYFKIYRYFGDDDNYVFLFQHFSVYYNHHITVETVINIFDKKFLICIYIFCFIINTFKPCLDRA